MTWSFCHHIHWGPRVLHVSAFGDAESKGGKLFVLYMCEYFCGKRRLDIVLYTQHGAHAK